MTAMDTFSTEIFIQLAEIKRLLRYMMFENPLEAEKYAVDIPELRETDTTGTGAFEFSTSDGTEYIVYSHGTKYTTRVRPTHIPSDKIGHIEPPPAGEMLWPRLQESCQALEGLSSDAYVQFAITKIPNSVAYFYSPRSTPGDRPLARYVEALRNLGEPSELVGEDDIRGWISMCRNQLLQSYASYMLAGDEVKQALATFILFELSPFPLTDLIKLNQEFFRSIVDDKLGDKQVVMAFPMMDIRFYLEHSNVPPDLAVVWGTSAARVLQDKAEELRDRAKLRYSVEQFHFELYISLLYYRCALYAYSTVLSSANADLVVRERAMQRLEEARSEVVLCEEHRVLIMVSLDAALGVQQVAFPSIANVTQFHNWVAYLLEDSTLARFIHDFEDTKSLFCYKHVVETVFVVAREAFACSTIARHSVCCSPIFSTSLPCCSSINGRAVPMAEPCCSRLPTGVMD